MKAYTVIQSDRKIAIDGLGTDDGWLSTEAARLEDFAWSKLDYYPRTSARLLYDDTHLFLIFECVEKQIKATHVGHQSEVWKDNCVELFVSPSEDLSKPYMNFEFNCLGYILLGYNRKRGDGGRVPIPEVETIECRATYQDPVDLDDGLERVWYLEAAIPLELLVKHAGAEKPKKGTVWRANFNKCSESTAIQHYATWNPIGTKNPDFHQPDYFGRLIFE